MIEWCESLTEAMFKVTNIVMLYAPIGVGAAIAYTIGVSGLQVLQNLGVHDRHAVRRAGGVLPRWC